MALVSNSDALVTTSKAPVTVVKKGCVLFSASNSAVQVACHGNSFDFVGTHWISCSRPDPGESEFPVLPNTWDEQNGTNAPNSVLSPSSEHC